MKTKVDKLSAATTVFVVAVILAMTILSCKQLFADPVQYLIMANADTQELYFSHQLEDDGVFSVSYIHSVNKTNVVNITVWKTAIYICSKPDTVLLAPA